MSDTCSVQVWVLKGDEKEFRTLMNYGPATEHETNLAVYMEFDDANHALTRELDLAVKACLTFVGQHGPGDNYSAGRFYCNKETEGDLVFYETGWPDQEGCVVYSFDIQVLANTREETVEWSQMKQDFEAVGKPPPRGYSREW